ncbi:hypothetical protein [Paenibacillus faecis]|nr:hypothetical protein [Paenibacillus faecis]
MKNTAFGAMCVLFCRFGSFGGFFVTFGRYLESQTTTVPVLFL